MPDDLQTVLARYPFIVAPFEFQFIGGPNDGKTDSVPSNMLEATIGGHCYRLAIAKSAHPDSPYKWVLVSRGLLDKP